MTKATATPAPLKPPLHAYQRKEVRTEVDGRVAYLLVAALILTALFCGILIGAIQQSSRYARDLERCEQQFGRECLVTAIPRASP